MRERGRERESAFLQNSRDLFLLADPHKLTYTQEERLCLLYYTTSSRVNVGEVKTKTLFDVDEVARATSFILLHASAGRSTKCSSKLLISVFFSVFFVKARKLRKKKRLSFELREK